MILKLSEGYIWGSNITSPFTEGYARRFGCCFLLFLHTGCPPIFVLFFSNHRARLEAGKFSELFGQRGTKLVKLEITFKNYYKNSNPPSLSYKVK